jgi:tRNA nucleotidyltransferase/poly(A) polymerase
MNDAPHTQQIAQLLKTIEPVLAPVRQSGWQWRIVGGAVRDLVLGRPVVDIDIEVVAPALADLEQCYVDMAPAST